MLRLITVDFDGTLFEGDSFKLMFQAGAKEFGILEWTTVITGSLEALFLGVIKGKQAFRKQFFKAFAKTFKGKSQEQLADFFQLLIHMGESQINQALVREIREHQRRGNKVLILSGALQPFLEALTNQLKLDVTTIGTELKYDEERTCTGDTGNLVNGDEKVKAVTNWLKVANLNPKHTEIWAYADSESDIPLLHFVDQPIIVNPKGKMKKIARANHWPLFGGN